MKYTPKLATKPQFDLLENDIKKHPLYKRLGTVRNQEAHKILESNCNAVNPNNIVPGNLILFKYLTPKTEEELEYYDAWPCTIFFGTFNSKQGRRIIGFNLHYYPAKYRQRILAKIFSIYKPIFLKYWKDGVVREIDGFDYQYIVSSLKKAKMDFGVRMYDPALCTNLLNVPPQYWSTAVFTEGLFQKETRAMIMKHWEKMKVKM